MSAGANTGFSPSVLKFLRDLERNNNRDWFAGKKEFYQNEVLGQLASTMKVTTAALALRRIPLAAEPKKSVFRIYRDTRFSADKSPYKTNLGVVFWHEGEKKRPGVLYLHVAASDSFAAAGFYQPEPTFLTQFRETIVDRWKVFEKAVQQLATKDLPLGEGEALKRVPRGFESFSEAPCARYLKLKSFIVHRPLSAEAVCSPDLSQHLVDLAADALPLLRFGWEIKHR
jgi:uncharacterized protein (TIGR02453 family)